jgi:hypothetical protein
MGITICARGAAVVGAGFKPALVETVEMPVVTTVA